MKGGHAFSGPAPDPNSLRGAKGRGDWTHLPAAGYTGPVPAWPLARPTARERRLWETEWRRPQAIMWAQSGQALEVAVYVRTLVVAEQPDASVAVRTLLRQQMESLGITFPSMQRLRWVIDAEPAAAKAPAEPGSVVDIRSRMRETAL